MTPARAAFQKLSALLVTKASLRCLIPGTAAVATGIGPDADGDAAVTVLEGTVCTTGAPIREQLACRIASKKPRLPATTIDDNWEFMANHSLHALRRRL